MKIKILSISILFIAMVFSLALIIFHIKAFSDKDDLTDSVIIPVDSDGISKRYFALISGNGEPEKVFFPERGKTELTKLFLKRVQQKSNILY